MPCVKHVQQDPTELAPLEKIFSTLGIINSFYYFFFFFFSFIIWYIALVDGSMPLKPVQQDPTEFAPVEKILVPLQFLHPPVINYERSLIDENFTTYSYVVSLVDGSMPLKHVQQDPTELAPLEKIFSTLGIINSF